MNYDDLERFIKTTMKMTHVYQSVMIKQLLEHNDHATTEDIARQFIDWDDSLLEYYKDRVKTWPKIILKKHKIINYEKNVFTLLVDEITSEQRKRLIELCDLRTNEFVDKYPNRLGAKINRTPVTGGIRYDVIARAKGLCQACGVSSNTRPIDVDHIIPTSRGGTNELDNLQALCYKCNREKNNRDKTNFVLWSKKLKDRDDLCKICKSKHIKANNLAAAIRPTHQEIHLQSIVIPKRHVGTFFDLIPAEKNMCIDMIDWVKTNISEMDKTVNGFDVSFASKIIPSKHQHCGIVISPQRG